MADTISDSILTTIKKLLGPEEDITHFDVDIMVHINSAIMILTQLGVGPQDGYFITSKDNVWSEFIGTNEKKFQAVKTYIYIKVRLVFDPPTSATLVAALEKQAKEWESRLNYNAEGYTDNV
jgi:hypothetical protein